MRAWNVGLSVYFARLKRAKNKRPLGRSASIYALLAYIQLHTFKRPLCVICLSACDWIEGGDLVQWL
nr:MAG TPA: hypothetical protein [Bacteriophage sp.]